MQRVNNYYKKEVTTRPQNAFVGDEINGLDSRHFITWIWLTSEEGIVVLSLTAAEPVGEVNKFRYQDRRKGIFMAQG